MGDESLSYGTLQAFIICSNVSSTVPSQQSNMMLTCSKLGRMRKEEKRKKEKEKEKEEVEQEDLKVFI